ncbi:MAG: hypothetical protein HC857_08760 [Synechococcales cyanobacterium RU_4_20]|nr:hypothetical protein [Synechococcales cyanobacterium RU_4_20]
MSPALLAASYFAIITAPLAIFGTHPLNLELGDLQVYQGKLEDVASPYLGAAAAGSLALGAIASRKRVRRSAQTAAAGATNTSTSIADGHLPSGESAVLKPVLWSRQHLLEQGLDAFLEPELDTDQPSRSLRHEPASKQTPARSQWTADPAEFNSIPSGEAVLAKTILTNTTLTETSLTETIWTRNRSKIHFQPQIHETRPAGDFVLESWAEAFLSDAPLGSLNQPSKTTVLPAPAVLETRLSPVKAFGQRAETDMESPFIKSPFEISHDSSVKAQPLGATVTPKSKVASQVVPFHHLHASAPVMPAAQTYASFVHIANLATSASTSSYSPARDLNAELAALEQLETVREQIQMLSAQMELLQANLNPQALGGKYLVALPSTTPKPTYTVVTTESTSEQSPYKPTAYPAQLRQVVAS